MDRVKFRFNYKWMTCLIFESKCDSALPVLTKTDDEVS